MTVSIGKRVLLALLLTSVATVYAGGCKEPRVRREWRSISEAEREEWIAAVKCLKKVPHKPALTQTVNITISQIPSINPNSSYFDDFVYTHMDLNVLIHWTGQFFPWHRAFVNDFEAALKTECGYKGTQPYWDWTMDASPNFPNSTMFSDSKTSGFGGWGNPADGYQITTGAFAEDFEVVYPVPHRIIRNYTETYDATPLTPTILWERFTPAAREAAVQGYVGDFAGIQAQIQGPTGPVKQWETLLTLLAVVPQGLHGAVHVTVGGDLFGSCPQNAPPDCVGGFKWSPNDPLFLLHHAMVDKVWYDWQNAHPENFWSFAGGSVGVNDQPDLFAVFPTGAPPFLNFDSPIPTDGILNNYTIFQVMNTKDERLCYVYE